ncbi:MAG: hypothetical protein HFG54_14325 [Lachnospiraceae bacterium]|jgi:hypothetical protein|nr:hypothetical protein [Lachnospiraceae bacterium]
MNFRDVRNQIVSGLSEYLEIPVCLSNQVSPEMEYPFVIYSSTSPYIPDAGLGEYDWSGSEGKTVETRREQPACAMSFTACSINREDILGDDEALELAEKAQGWFLHTGYDFISRKGITVVDVANVQERSFLQVDEEARRYGFDVMIRYARSDVRIVSAIGNVAAIQKGESDE